MPLTIFERLAGSIQSIMPTKESPTDVDATDATPITLTPPSTSISNNSKRQQLNKQLNEISLESKISVNTFERKVQSVAELTVELSSEGDVESLAELRAEESLDQLRVL
jgi:hypothetical protein